MCGGERGAELVDLLAVSATQVRELGGEGADDVAGGIVTRRGRWWRGLALLLGAELLDASAEL